MTKKDYVKLAAALKQTRPLANEVSTETSNAWKETVDAIVSVLRNDNDRFNAKRFYQAVGL